MFLGPLRSPHLLWVGAVVVAGCSGSDESIGSSHSGITPRYGVDYSFARPSPASIRAQGFTFAARYVSGDPGGGKDLSHAEADALIAAGIDVVVVWEASSTAALNGYNQGVSDARTANAEAASCGEPASRPIYFAVDFETNSGSIGAVSAYFAGVASVLGVARTGAYGGIYTIESLFNEGRIAFGWQTYAWSGGAWDGRAQLRQIQNGIDNDEEDEDEAVASDFGQWGTGAAPAPAPSPTRGSLDSVSCDAIAGWAQDPNSAGSAIPVDVYVDGPAGTGTGLGRFTAGDARSDLCSAIGSCDHGYTLQPPASLYDGHAHSIYVYGIAVTPGAPNSLLTGSPRTLHCAVTLTGDFHGSGSTDIAQFRDDWSTIPRCGRWGSDWSCDNLPATYLDSGLGAGNGGMAIYAGATPLVADVNGDSRDDVIQYNAGWQSIPVCLSTASGWACENRKATYVGGLAAGNAGTGVYAGGQALVGDVNGDGSADVVQYSGKWQSIPVCFSTSSGFACQNLAATYTGGLAPGVGGSGIYDAAGTTAVMADVNGDGKSDLVQFNPAWATIPVCFSTGVGWSCENLAAEYLGGLGAGNAGSGVFAGAQVFVADVNGDGKSDIIQYRSDGSSIPVCLSTGRGFACENLKAEYIGGLGGGIGGSGIYAAATVLVADVNGDGKADLVQYSPLWQSIPVCFSTGSGWACENLKADFAGPAATAGNSDTAVYPFGLPVSGKFNGGKSSGIVQIDPGSGWTTLPLCTLDATGWSCTSSAAPVH
jgi:hypothetical protein